MIPFVLAALVTLLPNATPQQGCEAHLVRDGVERVARCGEPVDVALPAVGWIESASSMTPFLVPIEKDGTTTVSTAVPAGTVTFPRDRSLAAGERIRLVSLGPPREGNAVRALFTRDVTSLASARMPAGRAVALLLDAKGRATAASPVFTVRAGASTEAWPATGTASFVAWLKRPRSIEREDEDRVTLQAFDAEPDAFVNASDSVFALWSKFDAREARVLVASEALRLANDTVNVTRTSLTMLDAPLELLPVLTVALSALPDGTTSTPMTLTIVETAQSHKVLRTLDVHPGQTLTIPALPAAPLTLQLRIGDFVLRRSADLTSGADARIDIALEPLTLSGTVFLGDEPARAIVRIQQREKPLETTTDERGAYSFTLWQGSRYVIGAVLAEHPEAPAFTQMVLIRGTTKLDIRIPANTLRVRVYDAATRKTVTGAQVSVQNRWKDEAGRESSVMGSEVVAGELTLLPPQRPGTSQIHVSAAGYRDSEAITLTIDEHTRERVIDVPMTATEETNAVTLRLPDGSPAAGAELVLWQNEALMWRGTADGGGKVAIPSEVAQQRLIVRHPSAASDVVLFGMMRGTESLTLPAAAPPLTVRVVRRDGSAFGPMPARLSLWLAGGVRLTGAEAGFATWSFGGTGPDGSTILRGLRPQPLRLFATSNASPEQIASGTFDNLAITIPYPWPAVATVTLADE